MKVIWEQPIEVKIGYTDSQSKYNTWAIYEKKDFAASLSFLNYFYEYADLESYRGYFLAICHYVITITKELFFCRIAYW